MTSQVKQINTHPLYNKVDIYRAKEHDLDFTNRTIDQNVLVPAVHQKKFWYTRGTQEYSPWVLSLPKKFYVPLNDRKCQTYPEPDPDSAHRQYSCTDDQLQAYLQQYFGEDPVKRKEKEQAISQVEFQGASSCLVGHQTWPKDSEDFDDVEDEFATEENSWLGYLNNLPLVMIRLTYLGIEDQWFYWQIFRGKFWEQGYLQYLDLDHNVFMRDQNDECFDLQPPEGEPREDGRRYNLLRKYIPFYENLKFLSFRCCKLGMMGLQSLVKSPLMKNLVYLDLSCCFWCNLEEDFAFYEECNFTCLKWLNLAATLLVDGGFSNIMGHVGHTIEYLNVSSNRPLTLQREAWVSAVEKNKAKTGQEGQCFRNLRVFHCGLLIAADSNILKNIIDFCDVSQFRELSISSLPQNSGGNIFSNSSVTWPNIYLLECGRATEKFLPQDMNLTPVDLFDVFYNSNAGKWKESDTTNISIGERVQCLTWSYENIDHGKPTGKKVQTTVTQPDGTTEAQDVDELEYQNNHLAYLVFSKYYVQKRVLQAQHIINLLKTKVGIAAINLTSVINHTFFQPPPFDTKIKYDLEFEPYIQTIWFQRSIIKIVNL